MRRNDFRLKKTVGDDYNVDPLDTMVTKLALNKLGHYPQPSYGITPFPDRIMFNAIKSFQKSEGLRVDGLMRPGGPTEQP